MDPASPPEAARETISMIASSNNKMITSPNTVNARG